MTPERPLDPEEKDPSTETLDATRTTPGLPDRIGRYHIKRVIASGGMGTVYEATQDNPRRVVAVKVMKQGIASKSALRRFEYEGQILGRLRHPGIAQIYEAGTHDDGHGAVPYFAMEYIPNAKPITKFAEEKKLGTRQRMELFAKVCDAIHHGHQKGIIHRDLKPSNILVDSTGQVKIIDFGVARSTDSDMAVTTLQTDVGQLIGTLQYMSPEQCEADPHDIDIRSDVYALGVVLYELLSGKLPYDVSRSKIFDGTRMIREQHPAKLSTLDRTLRGDVETIALKALEKERERRYQSAADFGHDIQRYLTGEAITARRASIVYQLRLFARRNKGVVTALAAVFVVLVTGVIVSTSLYLRAEYARTATLAAVVQQLLTEAKALEGEQRWQEAEQKYEALLVVDPTRLAVLGDMARMKKEEYNQQTGRGLTPPASLLTDAVQLCDRALAAMPNDMALWNTKGVLLKKLHRYEEAIVAYQKALELTPEFSAAYENLGIVYALAGDMPGAWRHLRKAAELAGTREKQCESPWRNLAAIELHLGKPEALEHVNQALVCNRTDPVTLRLRAKIHLELSDHGDVQKALEDVLNADFLSNGEDPIIKRIKAIGNLQTGRFQEAVTNAKQGIDLGDPLPTVNYLVLAAAQAKLGAIDAAREALQKATDLWPPELQKAASYLATAESGVLWFENADTLLQLKEQAAEALRTAP